ncbi:MAG: HAMP domain-containing histidine kinase [Candidatus Glassbacteria bacterium]|nr:HAMP domain-containing histidine kinase [Candidatus Glassbacteria bacterium]
MPQKETGQHVIRHRSVFTLPTRLSFWSLVLLTAVFFVMLLGYFLYTQSLVRDLERDEYVLSKAVAQFMVNAFDMRTGLEDQELVNIFVQYGNDTDVLRELVGEFDNPLAITDSTGTPVMWKSIGVPEDINTRDPEVLARIKATIQNMDRQNPPMRILNNALEEQFVVHYGDPPALTRLRTIPLYLGGMLVLFVVIALWILRRQARTERSLIWAGMARESAHQLGTPISSLYGWLELLKIKLSEARALRGSVDLETVDQVDGQEKEIVDGIGQDVERLSKVAHRFELIGRRSSYDRLDLAEVLRGTEQYFRARLPKRGKIIELKVELGELLPVRGNPTLLEWAFENIIKNSIDALTGRGGIIRIEAMYDSERDEVDIIFSDNGPGIPGNVRRHIFDTGVTTKSKGWGVGLALAKRIIEENHGGRIMLTQSSSDKGTVFLVTLPATETSDTVKQ